MRAGNVSRPLKYMYLNGIESVNGIRLRGIDFPEDRVGGTESDCLDGDR